MERARKKTEHQDSTLWMQSQSARCGEKLNTGKEHAGNVGHRENQTVQLQASMREKNPKSGVDQTKS